MQFYKLENLVKPRRIFFIIISSLSLLAVLIVGTDNSLNTIIKQYSAQQILGELLDRYYETFSPHTGSEYWKIEDPDARLLLPKYKVIKAPPADELTPALNNSTGRQFIDWHRSHGGANSSRYSSLDQVNIDNVANLEVAWTYRSGDGARTIQCNPVVADGLIYLPTPGHAVIALNAATGKEVWRREFKDRDPAKRGLVWWPGTKEIAPRIYFSAGKALVALDAKTGTPVAGFGDNGSVSQDLSRVAPAISGNAILVATFTPAVIAYDVITGEKLWQNNLNNEDMLQRQGGRAFKLGRGHPWGGASVDIQRDIFYVATGNPGPEHVGSLRPGRNIHTDSVSAFDINTGDKLWSFQETRHDLWDTDIPSPPILTTINRYGRAIDVVVVTTKRGNTLILDRVTGKPVYDFRLRRAPTSKLPGEKTWPYQPDLELPEPFADVDFGLDQVTNIGAENTRSVIEKIKDANFGFYVPPEQNVRSVLFTHGGAEWPGGSVDAQNGTLYVASNHIPWTLLVTNDYINDESTLPGSSGRDTYLKYCIACHGSNREGKNGPTLIQITRRTSAERIEHIIRNGNAEMPVIQNITSAEIADLIHYLQSRDIEIESISKPKKNPNHFQFYYRERTRLKDHEGYPGTRPPWGTLSAINLNNGKKLWQVPLGEYSELVNRGIPKTGTENFGGPTVTAGGLIFIAGTQDKKIRAFDKLSGKQLWEYELPFGGLAPPTTYEISGRQYIVIAATGGGVMEMEAGDTYVAFALPRNQAID